MDVKAQAVEAQVESSHWWFKGRRRLLGGELNRLKLTNQMSIFDVGCGTGGNLRLLKGMGFSNIQAIDPSDAAVYYCHEKGLGTVTKGDLSGLPVADASQDLVLAADVIEHIDDDLAALQEIHRVLKPDGYLVITVPTFQCLWGLQDEVSHHRRRYRLKPLRQLLGQAGYDVQHSYYFNFILAPLVFLARQIIRVMKIQLQSENQINTGFTNVVLGWVFRLDVTLAPYIRAPFGVSGFVLAQRRGP